MRSPQKPLTNAPTETAQPQAAAETISARARVWETVAAHRSVWRGVARSPPNPGLNSGFAHGFLLPFSLFALALGDAKLRTTYLRVALVRACIVGIVGIVAATQGDLAQFSRESKRAPDVADVAPSASRETDGNGNGHDERDEETDTRTSAKSVHIDLPGVKVDVEGPKHEAFVSLLGRKLPVTMGDGSASENRDVNAPRGVLLRARDRLKDGWQWLLQLVAIVSAAEFVLVALSRRWDDWVSFHASRLAAIRPEEEFPKPPKIALDVRWLYRKLKRRIRGYIVFASGIPALVPLRLLPTVGPWLFTLAVTLWGWYWLGVFTAAKSAHAWVDEETALPPAPIRSLNHHVPDHAWLRPLRWYGRTWARITHAVNPASATFERSPAAFLGLAAARVVLSLPGFYLLARPLVPVAAGRLCAESDPQNRFSESRLAPEVRGPRT